MKRRTPLSVLATLLCLLVASVSFAVPLAPDSGRLGEVTAPDGRQLGYAIQGLAAPNYDWWYGCSATSAGMLMGYYDINGYSGFTYENLVPGGVAEMNTFGNPGALVNGIIASPGHIADFWVAYSKCEDCGFADPMAQGHAFDCLADFMGTSQDDVLPSPEGQNDNPDGWTTFWFWTDGSRLTASDIVANGLQTSSGMYGIGEYVQYRGYQYEALYNQLTYDIFGYGSGFSPFTFSDFQAEIDAGRPMLVQVEGHTMLGYGYSAQQGTISVYDTWDDMDGSGPWTDGQNPGVMAWNGTYQGLQMYGVTGLQLAPIPEPTTLALVAMGLIAAAYRRRLK